MQTQTACLEEQHTAQGQHTNSANQIPDMAAAAEHHTEATVMQTSHNNTSSETSGEIRENSLSNISKQQFSEIKENTVSFTEERVEHSKTSKPSLPRPKNKILIRKNTPASLPKVDKLYCKCYLLDI